MKIKISILTLILFISSNFTISAQDKPKKEKKDNGKELVVFDVSMTCENCKKRITKNISFEKGVSDMKVDLANKLVSIEYKKDKTSIQNLQKALEALGYQVSLHKTETTTTVQ